MTQESLLLSLLRQRPRTTNELCEVHRVTDKGKHISLARELTRIISTLRRKGYGIEYKHGKGGTGTYTLTYDPDALKMDGRQGDCPS